MKNFRILIVVALLAFCAKASAYTPEIAFGSRQGVTMSMISFYPSVSQSMRLGYTGGITSRFIFEKYFGLQVELNYQQRGWQAKARLDDSPTFHHDRLFHYVELPFMTHIFFGKKRFRWFFNLGLNLSYLLGEKTNEQLLPTELRDEHTQKVANRFDYGICGGTGCEFHTRAGIYQIEARYNYGLGDIFPNTIRDDFGRSSNQIITVNLGILFDINKEKYQKK